MPPLCATKKLRNATLLHSLASNLPIGTIVRSLVNSLSRRRHVAAGLRANTPSRQKRSSRGVNDSIQSLSKRVHLSVVQIFSTGYSIAGEDDEQNGRSAGLITKQRSTGSGVILSEDGYIVTNNHVVQGARTVRVQLASDPNATTGVRRRGKILEAHVVGTDRQADLAVLKVDAGVPLPKLLLANSDSLRQGQMVLAFGNPLGLENSVSLGIVSSVGRQVKPDDSMVYIQTDAPINPGNSGGPLLDAEGHVVGINTFILSQSGGSEGIGFAIPSNIVENAYQQIKKDGHVHRGEIGVRAQSVTPELAAGLSLRQDWGVILGDVYPEEPGDEAGLKVGDIIVGLDGRQTENAMQFEIGLYRIALGKKVKLDILRGDQKMNIDVKVQERENDPFRFADLVKPEDNTVVKLGIVGIAMTKDVSSLLPDTRFKYGVIVAAKAGNSEYSGQGGLVAGDIIYAVNTRPISSLDSLRKAVDGLKAADPLVLQIERDGKLLYLVLSEE